MSARVGGADSEALVRVATSSGRLIGKKVGTVSVFKGIPYATPPVGALRWQPPRPQLPWDGDRLALEFGPAPMQVLPPRSSLMYRLNHDEANALVMSEDCLYLNVWSPDPSPRANLPVLVWIHGGANKTGHGGQDLFDGSRLAARGMVVVTVNMRLGALGFLSLPALIAEDPLGSSGNYGVQDVAAALLWVQENVTAFGGDPARVTVGGNSAGAATVTHLMAAPGMRGLFRAAIGQSASGMFRPEGRMLNQREAAELGLAAVSSLGSTLEQLRDLPATAFLGIPPQGVIVDGRLLVEETTKVFLEGRQVAVPLLVGWNADEGSLFASNAEDGFKSLSCSQHARAILDRTYPLESVGEGLSARRALIGDKRFTYPVWRWARTHAETSAAPTWLYEFDHQLPLPDDVPPPPDGERDYGAFHTAEVPYTWDNLAMRPWEWSDADHNIAQQLADAWTRFVADGDPNGSGLPIWRKFNASCDEHLMIFGETTKPGRASRREAFDVFDKINFRINW
ncbi:carboxylesterase/lipase family protein [Pseudomonas sp. GCM10022188]|uniref:carboxylesterase/lipase family protein n=1 Tax=Pseudomonas TaxID=286 RepID=UPI001E6126FF|nr:carboxylesterase family protein [Pseudomonas oryzagri]MCC6076053.1 carboxylesterase family protein [Pseudomonas oryzagri]